MLSKNLKVKLGLLCIGLFGSVSAQSLEYLSPLKNQHWLASVPLQGLQVIDEAQQVIAEFPGRYEQSQSLSIGEGSELVVAVNQNNNSLDIFNWNGEQLQLLQSQPENLLAIEGMCLYQEPVSSDIHAFVLMEHTEIQQRIIYHAAQKQVVNQAVRQLPVPDAVVACVVDSQREILYFAEESVGVWQMSAHPESEKGREAVSLLQPFGKLQDKVESLSLLPDGTLVIAQIDAQSLVLHRPDGSTQEAAVKGLTEAHAIQHSGKQKLNLAHGESIEVLQTIALNVPLQQNADFSKFVQISATAETGTMQKYGDAADDPAIWYNPTEPQKSLILGTDKKRGLAVYDLQGKEQQFLEVGRINNVDLRAGFAHQDKIWALASASQRDNNSITLFLIDDAGVVSTAGEVATDLDEVYGLCMYQDNAGHYVFINDKDGRYQQYLIRNNLQGELVREFKLGGQPEGCVANDATHELYVGIEDEGIWYTSAKATTKEQPEKIIAVGGNLKDDVEGLALYLKQDANYLVVSSQGNNSYALYQAKAPFDYLGSFQIAANVAQGIDGASETDGLEVSSFNFGGPYTEGMLVVQDGRNVMPAQPQNFKMVAFGEILAGLKL